MNIIFNPGTEDIPKATEEHAYDNMIHFIADLGIDSLSLMRTPDEDYEKRCPGKGRFAFVILNYETWRFTEIQMPGLPLEQVRYMGSVEQNIWDYPRLYECGSSWVWCYALDCARTTLTDEQEGAEQ